ncbi:MAG: hypothetical protein EPO24_08110 [Bacteroidetes bacterium]|nr:MAG: hypothetical protein EPO24_08110 [Bacteroidota bacterium]
MTVLFVVATIILFLTIDWFVRRAKEKKPIAVPQQATVAKQFSIRTPEGIYFTPSHTWMNLFPSGKVRLGIDDFVGRMFEKPRVTFLKKAGERVAEGEPLLMLQEGEHALTVRSPIECEILSENEELHEHSSLMYESLFSDGWAYTIKPARFADLRSMMLGPDSRTWMNIEFARLRDFFARPFNQEQLSPVLLQDGGMPVAGAVKQMSKERCQEFEEEFLSVQAKVK